MRVCLESIVGQKRAELHQQVSNQLGKNAYVAVNLGTMDRLIDIQFLSVAQLLSHKILLRGNNNSKVNDPIFVFSYFNLLIYGLV